MTTAAEIQAWLTSQIAGILSVSEDEIDPYSTFDSFGLASRDAVSLSGELEDYLDRRLSPTILYQYPTIHALADHLAKGAAQARAEKRDSDPTTGDLWLQDALVTPQPVNPLLIGKNTAVISSEANLWTDEETEARLLKKLLELDD